MRLWLVGAAAVLGCFGGAGVAQAPAGAPAGANGICRDGTYSTAASKSGACQGHKGVQTWYVATPKAGTTAAVPAPTPSGPVPAMPLPAKSGDVPAAMPAPKPGRLGPAAAAASKTAAPGGGPGLVWVNTASNVYHCDGDAFYGKTKEGAYMTEAEAKGKGAHGVRGATCGGK
jgi:hypothetical protein